MKLNQVLNRTTVTPDLKGANKREVIEELLDILMNTGKVSDRKQALEDLLNREEKMSTGIQYGVAIPHAKSSSVGQLVACVGIHKEGVEFEALDGNLSHIFVMTLSPLDRTGPHVQFLAEISKVLLSSAVRKQLLKINSPDEMLHIFHAL